MTAQGIEAGTAETERLGPKGESPVAEGHAPRPTRLTKAEAILTLAATSWAIVLAAAAALYVVWKLL